MRKHAMLSTK